MNLPLPKFWSDVAGLGHFGQQEKDAHAITGETITQNSLCCSFEQECSWTAIQLMSFFKLSLELAHKLEFFLAGTSKTINAKAGSCQEGKAVHHNVV